MYKIKGNSIIIENKEDFDIRKIIDSGQLFRAEYKIDGSIIYSKNYKCRVKEEEDVVIIETEKPQYFVNFFDLETDYKKIREALSIFPEAKEACDFGIGIRILKQDPLETVINFIVSSNNNIPRIKKIVKNIYEGAGSVDIEGLKTLDTDFFLRAGAGYRASYLYKTIRKISEGFDLNLFDVNTPLARNQLLELSGIGPKVADCILLFAFSKSDVFPVDTWIKKVYSNIYQDNINSIIAISARLVDRYKALSGYAQQYLFYYYRENKIFGGQR